jgi:hypothetical protein
MPLIIHESSLIKSMVAVDIEKNHILRFADLLLRLIRRMVFGI